MFVSQPWPAQAFSTPWCVVHNTSETVGALDLLSPVHKKIPRFLIEKEKGGGPGNQGLLVYQLRSLQV